MIFYTSDLHLGHIHNNTDAAYWPLIRDNPLMLNAGVEINGFEPVTLDEMAENNSRHKERSAAVGDIR